MDIRTIPKGVVDVVLGAVAYIAAADRTALPLPYSVAVIPFYLMTWIILVTLVLFNPNIIGGNSGAERFAELGPVIVLSIPVLWKALETLKSCIRLYDAIVGVSVLLHERFEQLQGLDGALSPAIMNGSVQIEHWTIDFQPFPIDQTKYIRTAGKNNSMRHMQPMVQSQQINITQAPANNNMDVSSSWFTSMADRYSTFGYVSTTYVDITDMKWRANLFPLVGEDLMVPTQITINTKFRRALSSSEMSSTPSRDEEMFRLCVKRIFSRITPVTRYLSRCFRIWTKRTTYGASLDSSVTTENNLDSMWQIMSSRRWTNVGLTICREAMHSCEVLISSINNIITLLVSFYDYLLTRFSLIGWVVLWEALHPLRNRRKHAIKVLLGSSTLVLDRLQLHYNLLRRYGRDRYLNCLSAIFTLRIFHSLLNGSDKLLREAIIMSHTGAEYRISRQSGITDEFLKMLRQLGYDQLLATDIGTNFEFLISLPETVDEVDTNSANIAIEHGFLPVAMVRKQDYHCGYERICSLPGTTPVADILWEKQLVSSKSRNLATLDFNRGSWMKSVGLFDLGNVFQLWLDNNDDELRQAFLKEMEDIAMDCHNAVRNLIWTRTTMNSTQKYYNFRQREQEMEMTGTIRRVCAHDLFVALHRRVITCGLCLFINEYEEGDRESWYKWCISEACRIKDLVEGEIGTEL